MNGTPGLCSSPRDCEGIKSLAYLLSDARSWESIRSAPFGPSRSSRMSLLFIWFIWFVGSIWFL